MTSPFYVTCTVSDTMMAEYVCNYMAVTSSKHCVNSGVYSGMYKCFSIFVILFIYLFIIIFILFLNLGGGGTDDDCMYVCAGVHLYLINSGPK